MKRKSDNVKRERCDSCEALMINGVFCHETGCPNAWRVMRSCGWCGQSFMPETQYQNCCSDECGTELCR